jgi:hypothetical protein
MKDVLLEFWDRIVLNNEPSFFYYFLVAFVIQNEDMIMKADLAELPVIMSNLNINSAKELDDIWLSACELKLNTP